MIKKFKGQNMTLQFSSSSQFQSDYLLFILLVCELLKRLVGRFNIGIKETKYKTMKSESYLIQRLDENMLNLH